MMKNIIKIFLLIINVLIITNCQSTASQKNEENSNLTCSLNDAENEIFKLEEVKQKGILINDISCGKCGITLISDSIDLDGKTFYQIQIGYNSPLRLEIYYTFYVEKGDCKIIRVLDVQDGNILSLQAWRNKYGEKESKKLILKETKLPFNYGEWNRWYKQQEYDNLPDCSVFNYYKVNKNSILNNILNKNKPLHEGIEPYLFFVLKQSKNFNSYLLFSKQKDEMHLEEGIDKLYDIVNIKDNSIISSLQVGSIAGNLEDGKSFNIDDSLKITVYDEHMNYESYGAVPRDTFQTTVYKIRDNGQIVKIE